MQPAIKISFVEIIICSFLAISCGKKYNADDNLSLSKRTYAGNELRIDGIYYHEIDEYYDRYAFYENGITRYLGGSLELNDPAFLSSDKKDHWGVFHIDSNSIKFERWYPKSGGPYRAYVRAGTILNDTTFIITQSYRMDQGNKTEFKEIQEVYYFHKFSPKPDSINAFIK